MKNDPPPDWKTSSDEAKRNLILDAALRVFGARGFDEPNMDDIAAEADYTRRSLYRFFQSKEELGISLAIRSCRLLTQSVAGQGTRLFDFAWAYFRFSLDHPPEFAVILETRELMLSGRTLPLRDEWLATDDFGAAFASRSPLEREALAAAIGYVEFRFRHRTVWQESGLAGDEDAVKTILERILAEENS